MRKLYLLVVMAAIAAGPAALLFSNGQAATTNRVLTRTIGIGAPGNLAVGQLIRAPIPAGALHPRHQWLRCNTRGARCSQIRNANQRFYRIRPADLHHTLRARITWGGSSSATTSATGLVHSGDGSSLQPVGDPLGRTWTGVLDDEFNGTGIDTSKWVALTGWRNNNETSNPKNCTESGGNLILALPGDGTGCDLYSNKRYGAGANAHDLLVGDYLEARIWFPGPGSNPTSTIYNWPAFWAYDGTNNWNAGEIDIAETFGHMEANYHSTSANVTIANPPGNWANSWHVYGVYRGATEDQIFYDGTVVGMVRTSDDGGLQSIMFTSGKTNACCGAPSITGPAANVLVDWVREWN
jgi:hypothetical protein